MLLTLKLFHRLGEFNSLVVLLLLLRKALRQLVLLTLTLFHSLGEFNSLVVLLLLRRQALRQLVLLTLTLFHRLGVRKITTMRVGGIRHALERVIVQVEAEGDTLVECRLGEGRGGARGVRG